MEPSPFSPETDGISSAAIAMEKPPTFNPVQVNRNTRFIACLLTKYSCSVITQSSKWLRKLYLGSTSGLDY